MEENNKRAILNDLTEIIIDSDEEQVVDKNENDDSIFDASLEKCSKSSQNSQNDYDFQFSQHSMEEKQNQTWARKKLTFEQLEQENTKKKGQFGQSISYDSDTPEIQHVQLEFNSSDEDEIEFSKENQKTKIVDFSNFPKSFENEERALDCYNERGYAHKL